jgi:hypothetical protein
MADNNLFEYAVIRYVPRPEREEFLNIGVIIFCKSSGFLQMKYELDEKRILAFYEKADLQVLKNFLKGFEEISNGSSATSPIAKLDAPSRFRWLTAVRSTIVQTSKVHPGLCLQPQQTLEKLFGELVRP